MKHVVGTALIVVGVSLPAAADREASNRPHVAISEGGQCYAKSVPAETYGERGTTKIYIVGRETDGLVHTLPWYSSQIYLSCIVGRLGQKYGISVVQMGPWARGQEANADTLAIAFYFDGKLVKRYSTLDIAGSPKKVSPSVSHYEVFQAIRGFRRIESNFSVFEVWTADKRLLSFDPTTGEILKPEELEK